MSNGIFAALKKLSSNTHNKCNPINKIEGVQLPPSETVIAQSGFLTEFSKMNMTTVKLFGNGNFAALKQLFTNSHNEDNANTESQKVQLPPFATVITQS